MEGTDFRQTLKLGATQLGLWNPNQDELTPVAKVALPVLSLIGAFYLHTKKVISHRTLAVLSVTIVALSYRFFITATQKENSSLSHTKETTKNDGGAGNRKAPPSQGALKKNDVQKIFKTNHDTVSKDTQLKEGVEKLSQLDVTQEGNGSIVVGEMDFSSDEEDG